MKWFGMVVMMKGKILKTPKHITKWQFLCGESELAGTLLSTFEANSSEY